MRLPNPRFTIRRIMVGILFVALILALVAQSREMNHRVAKLEVALKAARAGVPADPFVTRWGVSLHAKVEAAGDRVLIAAVAEVTDWQPDPAYVWSVVISDPSRKVLYRKRYDDRPVRPSRGQAHSAPFTEVLRPALPPGDYRVRISLLGIPEDQSLSWLDDENNASLQVVGSTLSVIKLTADP